MLIKKGYTLIELLLVLMLTSLLLRLALPSWQELIVANRATTAMNQLVTAINLAKNVAIHRGVTVTLCQSADQHSCSGNWADGQIVFVDRLKTGKVRQDADIIRVFEPLTNKAILTWSGSGPLQISPHDAIYAQPGTFCYFPPDKNPHYIKAIVISMTGRVRLAGHESCKKNNPLCLD